jgi:hypothetical protein
VCGFTSLSGQDQNYGGGHGPNEYAGEHVEGVVDAEVDAREGDEEAREDESRCEGRVDGGESYGTSGGGGGVPGGEGARRGCPYKGGYLGVGDKRTGAPSAIIQETATAVQGTRRSYVWRPVAR